jgi:glycosyltransferase involved in cell wall biosynthesis
MESALIPLLLRRIVGFRPPIIIWEVPWSPGWAYREWVGRRTIPRADRSVVFSKNQIDLVHRTYGKNARSVFVPFAVDIDFFQPQPDEYGAESYILSVGIDYGRDYGVLLKVSRDIPSQFWIKINHCPIDNPSDYANVKFITNYISYTELRKLYNASSIVVISTLSTPNACGVTSLMEAMAMGKPTIVSNNPMLRDYLPPPDAGVVVPIGDSAALRTAILDLQRNPAKAKAMGKKARVFAEQRFHPDLSLKVMTDLFWDIAEEAGTAVRPRIVDSH